MLAVWSDVRTKSIVDEYSARIKSSDFLSSICGLPISTYFSAVKINWLIDNVEEVQTAVKDNRCLFGTVDSWIVWVRVYYDHCSLYLRHLVFVFPSDHIKAEIKFG